MSTLLNDSDRLMQALLTAGTALSEVVGIPQHDNPLLRAPVNNSTPVDREQIAFSAHAATCNALECIGRALAVLDPDPDLAPMLTVEDGLAAMTRHRDQP